MQARLGSPIYSLEIGGVVVSDYLHIGVGLGKPIVLRELAPRISQLLKEKPLEEAMFQIREMRRKWRIPRHEFFRIGDVLTIPASSIKGNIRAIVKDRDKANKLFGSTQNPSMLNFTNAPIQGAAVWKRVKREIRGKMYEEEYELVPRNSTFGFKVLVCSEETESVNLNMIRELLSGRSKIGAMKHEKPIVNGQPKEFGTVELKIEREKKI
jgi:hypothetical protein